MTDEQLMQHLTDNTPLNQLRAVVSGEIGRHEQAGMQRATPTPIGWRKMEFQSLDRILAKAEELGLVIRQSTIDAQS